MRWNICYIGLLSAPFISACASMGFSSDQGALKKQVAFDTDCPAEQVNVVSEEEGGVGQARFVVDACGKRLKYMRAGYTYYDASKPPPGVPQ